MEPDLLSVQKLYENNRTFSEEVNSDLIELQS